MVDCIVKVLVSSNKESSEHMEHGSGYRIPIDKEEKFLVEFNRYRCGDLCIKEYGGRTSWCFRFFPFVPDMLICYNHKVLERGRCYQFAGDDLGKFSLRYPGHPGDQEYLFYVIKRSDIRISYSSEQITIFLNGQTYEGEEYLGQRPEWSNDPQSHQFPELNFAITIYVPTDETLQKLLNMHDVAFAHYKQFLEPLNRL